MNSNETICPTTDLKLQPNRVDSDIIGLAPIALFVYNRPEHTRRTVERLQENLMAKESDLHIFSDAAKNENASEIVNEVRSFIRTIGGFHSVSIVERSRNLGLAASVIDGIAQLCDRYGQVIAVEDDLLTAPDFLRFMNAALDRYRFDSKVFSIGAFNYDIEVPHDYPWDTFFTYRSCSWGWATWKDRWCKADWKVSDYQSFRSDKKRLQAFSRGGGDLPRMLAKQMSGQVDSWAIRWAYAHYLHDAAALLPTRCRVHNIGFDGSGTHCRRVSFPQGVLSSSTGGFYRFPDRVSPDPDFSRQIRKMHPGSFAGRLGKYLLRKLRRAA